MPVDTMRSLPTGELPIAGDRPTSVPNRSNDVAASRLELDELRARMDEAERRRIVAALEACAGNQTKAARALGISRGTLVARLEAYGLPRPRK